MNNNQQIHYSVGCMASATVLLICILVTPTRATAQALKDVQLSKSPLILKAQGSFYIGGETVEQTQVELGSFGPAGHICINQMYVRYMIPESRAGKASVVMIHGMTLTGKTWETTPDGRMGWDEYFVRKGHPVYVPDQIARGRSGFSQAAFNNVRTGAISPNTQAPMLRFSNESTWPNFRIGPTAGTPFADTKFPTEAILELAKQAVPDLSMGLSTPNPNYKALSDLALQLKNAVLVSHSQSGNFPLQAGLEDSTGVKGAVLVEPGGPPGYSDSQIKALTKIPILVVFGDHLGEPTGIPGHSWQTAFDQYKTFVARINAVGGNARMLLLPEKGIRGNSHMIMQDKNNQQVADLILKWIDQNVTKKKEPLEQVTMRSRVGKGARVK